MLGRARDRVADWALKVADSPLTRSCPRSKRQEPEADADADVDADTDADQVGPMSPKRQKTEDEESEKVDASPKD